MKKNNFKSLMQAAVLICTPLVIASCDDVFGDADNPIPSYMSIKEGTVNLVLHADSLDKATYTRTAIAASGAEIVYSSSDEKIATVDATTGKITAVGEGECDIIAEATGKDSHGNMTYQQQKVSFPVKVKDYRARIALKEGVVVPVYNSARNTSGEKIDLKDYVDVWPALGTTNFTISNVGIDATTPVISAFSADGKITLSGAAGVAKVVAKITAVPTSPTDAVSFETKSFGKTVGGTPNVVQTDTLIVKVENGVAYISYDAEGKAVTNYMFKNFNGEKVTDLHDVLYKNTGTAASPSWTLIDNDVYIEAGWYYLDQDITFNHNIRVKGDVNIILGQDNTLTMNTAGKSIMDETMTKSYSLNFYKEAKTTGSAGEININTIQDFKEVNFVGGTIAASLNKIGTVNINDGTFANLENIGTLNFKKGTVNTKFNKIGTANISDGTFNCDLDEVTTLNFKKGTVKGNLNKIGTATISDGAFGDNTTPNLITIDGTSINIKKGTVYASVVKAALIIDGGTVNVNANGTSKSAITGNVTMNDGTLTVVANDNGKQAIVGDVEVVKGTFTAINDNYAAVSGTLTGKFKGSIDSGNTWTDITTATSSAARIKNVVPAP
jgi:hypothetical protein